MCPGGRSLGGHLDADAKASELDDPHAAVATPLLVHDAPAAVRAVVSVVVQLGRYGH